MSRTLVIASASMAFFAIGGCGRRAAEPSDPCAGGVCGAPCAEGEVRCLGDRAGLCQSGTWIERVCDIGCREGRCVDCYRGDRRCVDESTAQTCEAGRYVVTDCGAARCMEGYCGCPPDPYRCAAGGREKCGGAGIWTTDPCPSDQPVCSGGACLVCTPGSAVCISDSLSKVCSVNGMSEGAVACPSGCDSSTGMCSESCDPGSLRCRAGRVVERCAADGGQYEQVDICNIDGGERCVEGECRNTCAEAADQMSPSGCLFYAPPIYFLHQGAGPGTFGSGPPAALYLLNPDDHLPAEVRVRQGDGDLAAVRIPAARFEIVLIPGRTVSPIESQRINKGAVIIESNHPIIVILHFDHDGGGESPRSGDTAYLLPFHIIAQYGYDYRIVTQPVCAPHTPLTGGFTVVATAAEPTLLHMDLTVPTAAAAGGDPGTLGPGSADITLSHGDVIHFRTGCAGVAHCPNGASSSGADGNNLTGSFLHTSEPVAVFNGGVSRVPCRAGHIQTQLLEQLMPIGLWSAGEQNEFVLSARTIPGSQPGDEQWVVLTHEAPNVLLFEPPLPSSPNVLTSPGSWFSFDTLTGYRMFRLETSKPALVARYFFSTPSGGGSTFAVERPTSFWRTRYDVAAMGRGANRILMVIPAGESISLNGATLDASRRAGPSGHELVEVGIERGMHRVTGSAKFGLFVYGHGIDGPTPNDCYSYTGPVGFGDR